MKKNITIFLLLLSFSAIAQDDYKPNLFVGGILNISSSKSYQDNINIKSQFNLKRISFQPTLGTIITDKWDLGISFKFTKSTSYSVRELMTPVSTGKTETNFKYQNFDFGIFSRYHFYKKNLTSLFLQPFFSFGNAIKKNNNTNKHTFQSIVGLSLGGVLQIQKHFKLLFHFGEINYYFIGVRPENGLEKKSSKFLSKIQFSDLGLGVEYVF